MNPNLKNLEKIEFVITDACTGRCKHCSQGEHRSSGECIDSHLAAEVVGKVASMFSVQTVMTFGGEPLLFPDTVCAIMKAATEMKVPKRQVITNGFFTKNEEYMGKVCTLLAESGVNEILLSVDAFHGETIPFEIVKTFANKAKKAKLPVYLQPAWLVSPSNDNPYNRETRRILDHFSSMGFCENQGNIVFPEGNAKKFLSEYFTEEIPRNPYVEDPRDVHCLSFSANGDVLDSNIYHQDILDILHNYKP